MKQIREDFELTDVRSRPKNMRNTSATSVQIPFQTTFIGNFGGQIKENSGIPQEKLLTSSRMNLTFSCLLILVSGATIYFNSEYATRKKSLLAR